MSDNARVRLVGLQAENVKRLKAVSIKFGERGRIEIAGPNGAGKSSVLDAIYWAIGGASAISAEPIRAGQDSAFTRLDLGSLIVERRFNQGGSTLTVKSKEGFTAQSPQAMLDTLFDPIAFDLPAFLRMKPQDKVDLLKRAISSDVDFDNLETRYDEIFAKRRDTNRDAKAEQSAADLIPENAELPTEIIDVAELSAKGQIAVARNGSIANAIRRREVIESEQANCGEQIAALERRRAELADEFVGLADLAAEEKTDTGALRADFAKATETNAAIEQQRVRTGHVARAEGLELASAQMTKALDDIKRQKVDAIAAAQMPVDGLSWDESGVMLNELPFDQAGQAERLRTVVAIAAALNPRLRIIRIDDAALFDSAGLAELARIAEEHDFQILTEVINPSDETSIVIEDGVVVNAEEDAA
ncbi:MAG: AAA family ATPase [Geminicoccaceae bacterium]